VKIYEFDIVDNVRGADVGKDGLRDHETSRTNYAKLQVLGGGSLADPERSGYVAISIR
jgi:hypothetical protein